MAYNTNNPVGSTDPRDLFDNAGNMDKFENGPNPLYPDRFGVQKLSRSGMIENFNNMLAGQEAEFQQFLTDSGFVSLGNYAPGLSFTAYNQYMARGGFFYRPAPSSLPFTTSGTWAGADEDLFVLFSQDDVLRQDLSDFNDPTKGSALVGYKGRTLRQRIEAFYSPMDYGAAGDGLSDDSASVQQCLNDAASAGKPVVLEGRDYLCNAQIIVPPNSSIFGPGKFIAGPASAFPVASHLGFFLAEEKDNVNIELVSFDISAWTSLPAGVASLRSVLFKRSNEIRINSCNFLTTGGGPAFIGCKGLTVTENKIVSFPVVGVDNGFADGMIDIWTEFDIDASRCVVANNIIQGQGFGRWGIMLTGLTFEVQVMQVDSVTVTGNVIENTYFDGIWAFGRNGGFFGASISGNSIGGARKGISISDCSGISVVGNSVRNTRSHGLHLWTETAAGGTLGATGCTITGNVLKDVAQVGASTPAIWLDGTSSRNTVSGNTVIGTSHFYGLAVGPNALYNEIGVNAIEKGAGQKYLFNNTKTKYLGNAFTPTVVGTNNVTEATLRSARASIAGDTATVYFRISVTPTTGAQFTRVTITLPYDSDVTTYSLFGGASQSNGESAVVSDDAAEDKASLQFTPASNAQRDITGWFSYRIVG